ncbi:MAG TPA: BrnT family toxin [Candidatus Woesebacteria bacterium]|nr:BrnT family toxin [Candidatus Woesebacteria bacterium]
MIKLPNPIEFLWDKGNRNKNKKHNVTDEEAEEIFYNELTFVIPDEKHSEIEQRHSVKGTTQKGIKLTVIITIRKEKVRIISARDMNKRERREYEKIKTNSTI